MIADLARDDEREVPRPSYGAKCDRLLQVRAGGELAALVPSTLPLAPLDEHAQARRLPPAQRRRAYADALAATRSALADEAHRTCGPPPWIIRSSGDEDGLGDANAGAYDSMICPDAERLPEVIAAVALSGSGNLSRRQRALSGDPGTAAIPCFVQPLLRVGVAPGVEPEDSPYLDDRWLADIEAAARRLLALFDLTAVDCEWGIETDQGFISATTLLPRDQSAATGLHALGFGFGAAQATGSRPTATSLLPAGTGVRLWRGSSLRRCAVQRLWLLQVRPARLEPAFREVPGPVAAAERRLEASHDALAAVPLLLGRRTHGRYLAAPTLMGAWRDYLLLDAPARARLDLVLVSEGSAAEHAAIMFRQERITCLTLDVAQLPPGASAAVFDGARCFIGDETMVGPDDFETQRRLVLPSDCSRIARPGDTATAIGASLAALPLDPVVRASILRRSLIPHEDRWLADGPRVSSPTLAGRSAQAAAPPPPGAPDEFATLYAAAAAMRGDTAGVRSGLPRLCSLAPEDTIDLARCPDLRVPVALLRCERMAWTGDGTLAALLGAAAALLRRGRAREARLAFEAVVALDRETTLLPIYDDADRGALLTALVAAVVSVDAPADLLSLQALGMPAPALAALLEAAARDETLLEAARAFADARAPFRAAPLLADAPDRAARLLRAFRGLRDALHRAGVAEVEALVTGSLVEDFDATLKSLLGQLAGGPDVASWQRYLRLLHDWIGFARSAFVLDDEAAAALSRLVGRLDAWADEPPAQDYAIEDRNWRVEFRALAEDSAEPYENPHVVHNLLHQWMLATNAITPALLPTRLRALHRFNQTFSTRAAAVLRFERDLVEISVPMGTHKASFTFRPSVATVEWSEPPDCGDDEIARLLAFGTVLDRFQSWWPGTLHHRREKVAGTWTLLIRRAAPAGGWRIEDLFRVCAQLRLLFDGAYDFSYVPNSAVDGLAGALRSEPWREVFERLIGYRLALDDTGQYVALHTQPLSSWLAGVAQSAVARGMVARAARADTVDSLRLVDRFAEWLKHSGPDHDRFARRLALLRLLCLMMAAFRPADALRSLASSTRYTVGQDLIASALLRRSDMRDEATALAAGMPLLDGFAGLVSRHAPALLITAATADAYAAVLRHQVRGFRRARQHLVAHHAAVIDVDALGELLAGLDTVPFGVNADHEQAIAAVLARIGDRLRFDIARGIDWTSLGARPADGANDA